MKLFTLVKHNADINISTLFKTGKFIIALQKIDSLIYRESYLGSFKP